MEELNKGTEGKIAFCLVLWILLQNQRDKTWLRAWKSSQLRLWDIAAKCMSSSNVKTEITNTRVWNFQCFVYQKQRFCSPHYFEPPSFLRFIAPFVMEAGGLGGKNLRSETTGTCSINGSLENVFHLIVSLLFFPFMCVFFVGFFFWSYLMRDLKQVLKKENC